MPVSGSLKIGILGVTKVKRINNTPIKQINKNASQGRLHLIVFFLNKYHSKIKIVAADTKNIAMFIKSGDLPNAPL